MIIQESIICIKWQTERLGKVLIGHTFLAETEDKLSALGVAADSKGEGAMTIFFIIA